MTGEPWQAPAAGRFGSVGCTADGRRETARGREKRISGRHSVLGRRDDEDLEGTKAFYATLFGWEASTDPSPEAGGYTTFRLRGKDVAAASPSAQPDARTGWKTYITSDLADATAAKITEAGGSVLAEPFDVLDAGRMAVAGDPTGGVFGVWQAGVHKGAQLVNEPGTWNWSELATRDVATARAFYSAVFGWESEELTDVPGGYHVQTIDGHRVAGILPISPEMGNMPTGWGSTSRSRTPTPRQQRRRSSPARSSPSRSTSPSAGQHGSSTR